MINIRTLRKLNNNDGLTLRQGKPITYKSGYQVATEGVEVTDITQVRQYIKAYNGNCGIWYSEGVYYIDKSHRVGTKQKALEMGRQHNQQSILQWNNMRLVWC